MQKIDFCKYFGAFAFYYHEIYLKNSRYFAVLLIYIGFEANLTDAIPSQSDFSEGDCYLLCDNDSEVE